MLDARLRIAGSDGREERKEKKMHEGVMREQAFSQGRMRCILHWHTVKIAGAGDVGL